MELALSAAEGLNPHQLAAGFLCHMQELFLNSLPLYQAVLTHPLIIENGDGAPPAGPGWGTDLKDEVVAQHPPVAFTPVESEPYLTF